ncbi:hypothetical protein ACLOJK_013064 [Asimina triloba]
MMCTSLEFSSGGLGAVFRCYLLPVQSCAAQQPSCVLFCSRQGKQLKLATTAMSPTGYTVEVTHLSPNAAEKDVYDFFAFSGAIEHVEIMRYKSALVVKFVLIAVVPDALVDVFVKHRYGDYACTAYVTFKERHALETAVLLSGATIVDQPVCIARWGHYEDDTDFWGRSSWGVEDYASSSVLLSRRLASPHRHAMVEEISSQLETAPQEYSSKKRNPLIALPFCKKIGVEERWTTNHLHMLTLDAN